MKVRPLTPDEIEDFWAMNVSVEATYVSDAELARALVENRVHRGILLGTRDATEAFWHRAPVDLDRAILRAECIVVPPGQLADAIPFLGRPHEHDLDPLWDPFWRGQILRLAGALPESRHAVAMAECARVLAALDAVWNMKLRPRDHATAIEEALHDVMDRIDEVSDEGLDKDGLRFEVLRTLAKIAWDRPWQPVDVEGAWV